MTTDLDRLIEAVEAGERNRNDGILYRLFGDSWMHAWDVMDRDSIDAAVTLLEALLPGRNWSLDGGSQPYAVVWSGERNWSANECADASNPARALLLATLRAYRANYTINKETNQ